MKLNIRSRLADGIVTAFAIVLLSSSATGAQQGQIFQPNNSGPAPAAQGSDSTLELKPLFGQGLPSSGTSTARQRSSKQQIQLSGCWSAVIRRQNLTNLQRTGSVQLGNWFNESYRICFAKQTATVQVRELSAELIVYHSSEAEISDSGSDWALIRSRLVWDDMDQPTNPYVNGKPDPRPRPLPHPYQVDQRSEMNARLVGDRLQVIDRSTATANSAPAYQLSWSAEFLKD